MAKAQFEFQLKIKTSLKKEAIVQTGARRITTLFQKDKYFIPKNEVFSENVDLIRIRQEEGREELEAKKSIILTTSKGKGTFLRKLVTKKIHSEEIEQRELRRIKKEFKELITIQKQREVFILGSILIFLDKVKGLGSFLELKTYDKKAVGKIHSLVKKLGLNPKKATELTYFKLALANLSPKERIFTKITEKLSRFIGGISGAVLTTLGVIAGLEGATSSKVAVISGIISVAVSDSLSDAFTMYTHKRSERGVSEKTARRAGLNILLGKSFFTLTFLVPFLFMSSSAAISIIIAWGIVLLIFVNFQIAFIREENAVKTITKTLLIATVILVISFSLGKVVFFLVKQ